MQYSPVLHVVIHMHSSDQAHGDHEQQLAKIMAEVGSSPGVPLHELLDKDSKVSKESLNNKERIHKTKTR